MTSTMPDYCSADMFTGRNMFLNISMHFTGSYYGCYTVLRVPAMLSNLPCRQFGEKILTDVKLHNLVTVERTLEHDGSCFCYLTC